jgi:signal transduction histidine kinase
VGIRGRLVWLSVGVAVPLALVGLAALWGLWRESREQVNLSVEGQAQLAAVAFERWIEGQRHPLQTIAAQLGAPRAASGGAGATAQQPEALAPLLRAVVSNRPYWLDLHALDARGATLLAQPPQTGPLPPGVVTDVLEELRRRGSWAVITDWTRSGERPVIILAAPVEGGGAVVARADGAAVGELFRDIRLAPGGVIVVFDARRRILYRSPTLPAADVTDVSGETFFRALGARQAAAFESVSPYDGVRRVYGLARAGEADSVVLVGVPTGVLLEPARRQLTRYALFSLLALLCAAGTAVLLARGVVRPVQRLERATRRLGAGDLAARAPAASRDEFGRLGASFNRMAERIAEREERLTELDRLKSEFVSGVSHELRTPLTTIKTLTRLLLRGRHTEAERREYLEAIAQECERQIDLVVNLLDLSRIESGAFDLTLKAVDAGETLRACATAMRHAAEARGQDLRLELDEELPPVSADAGALRRVVNGLVENALKYTPEGGAVTLRAARDEREPGLLSISVTDTGRGIEAEDLPHVFEKFYRGRAAGSAEVAEEPGVGLGLYLARVLVERMGGSLAAESRPGEGSAFTVRLPAYEGGGEEAAQREGVAAGARKG